MANPRDVPADTITLDETARHRRRLLMNSDHGIEFLLDLPATTLLGNGDRLLLDDGREIEVRAAREALYEIRGRDAVHLLKLTWHMGNRHLPTEIRDDHVRIRDDAVIARMIEELGGQVTPIKAAFDPEGGAYGGHRADG